MPNLLVGCVPAGKEGSKGTRHITKPGRGHAIYGQHYCDMLQYAACTLLLWTLRRKGCSN